VWEGSALTRIVSAASGTVIGFIIGCGCPALHYSLFTVHYSLKIRDLGVRKGLRKSLFVVHVKLDFVKRLHIFTQNRRK